MSVATKNPFALLDDDEATSAPVTTQDPAPVPAPAARGDPAQRSRGGPASRGGKYYPRGGKSQQSKDSAPPATDEANKPANDARGEYRGRGRGTRDGRGRGRGRGGDGHHRGRPFDRHSQTGQTDSEKKIHQSWGGDDGNTELKTETAATVDAAVESNNEWAADPAAAADWGAPAETSADAWATPAADPSAQADAWATPATDGTAPDAKPEGRPRREREPEEDDNTLTLDQYLAQQKEKDTVIPKLENTRKANDGADDIWKDVVPLAKNEEEAAYFVGKSKTYKPRAKKEDKVYLEIDARFDRPDRGGGGRGRGRGERGEHHRGGDRGRGSRGRGGTRGGRQNGPSNTVNVDDQNAFPSLS